MKRFLSPCMLLALLLGAGTGTAATPVGTCTVISLAGEYRLTNNIINTSMSNCISINANNVVFDGAGFTVTGGGNGSGVFVYNPNNILINITIKNLKVTNWYNGIYLWYSNNSKIIDNAASNNSWIGIALDYSSDSTVTGNTASNNNQNGISIYSSDNSTVTGNTASNNSLPGIALNSSNYSMVTGNTASNNSQEGLYIISSSGSTITGNTASNNDYGIYIDSSDNSTVIGNTASNNNYGIYLLYSNNSMIIDNVASNNSHAGIVIESSSNPTQTNNTGSNNSYFFRDAFSGTPSYSIISYTNDIQVNGGDSVNISIYISGAGDIDANKLSFHAPPDILDQNRITVIYYDVTSFEKETPNSYNLESGEFDWNLSQNYFTFDDYSVNQSTAGALFNFGEESHYGNSPITITFKVNKNAPPGDHEISTLLFYKNGTQWSQSEKRITIHIRFWYEKYWYYIISLISVPFIPSIITGIIIGLKYMRKRISSDLEYLRKLGRTRQ